MVDSSKHDLVVERCFRSFVRNENFVNGVNNTIICLDVPCNDFRWSLVSTIDEGLHNRVMNSLKVFNYL